ncbi:MAG: glycosyltransferase [Microcoleus sp.]
MAITNDRSSNNSGVDRDRRVKSTLVVLLVWSIVSLLHWQPQTQWFVLILTAIFSLQTARMLLAKPTYSLTFGNSEGEVDRAPVSIIVPAKNESAVLTDLVVNLFHLNYPTTHLEIWIVDDGSIDETPEILSQLQTRFPSLQVHQRESKGGKSGALNAVFPFTRGEIILVCDADAQLPADFLQQTVSLFQNQDVGAVQVRKSIANADTNFLTRCQQMEMNCDAFLQSHRIAAGGITELRGNGMLVRRELLEKCNGWSEDTLTDDLDITFKLYLIGTKIEFFTLTAVGEEGVTTWGNLWQQHCRWAEGGYQRYLDYFPQIFTLEWQKEIDLWLFFLLQFLLPVGLIPDIIWTIVKSDRPVLLPLQTLLGFLLTVGFMAGVNQFQNLRGWRLVWGTIQGSLYMIHWIPVMVWVTLGSCVKQGRSNWVKTEHYGRSTE